MQRCHDAWDALYTATLEEFGEHDLARQAVVGDQLRYARGLDGDSGGKLLARYLQVSARFARLVKTLWHLARSKGNTP